MGTVTVVGGGIAGLVAAITSAEAGEEVRLVEARARLGGRARTRSGPYVANLGPHALYSDGPLWGWLQQRRLLPPVAKPPLRGVVWHVTGECRPTPPVRMLALVVRFRGASAPAGLDLRTWLSSRVDARTAEFLSSAAGVFSFHHDPGSLSAAFVWERARRVLLTVPPVARYPLAGWASLIRLLERRARALGVEIRTSMPVTALPDPPVVVATDLSSAGELLEDPGLMWPSGHTVCLDLGLRPHRSDPFVVSDLTSAGWVERYTAADPSFAPAGEELVQAQMPIRPEERPADATRRLEALLDASFERWRERITWRRRLVMSGKSGAVDPPGSTWHDRPAVDRGAGVFLCGDMVAAPGLLAEVSLTSAVKAGRLAAEWSGAVGRTHLPSGRSAMS